MGSMGRDRFNVAEIKSLISSSENLFRFAYGNKQSFKWFTKPLSLVSDVTGPVGCKESLSVPICSETVIYDTIVRACSARFSSFCNLWNAEARFSLICCLVYVSKEVANLIFVGN